MSVMHRGNLNMKERTYPFAFQKPQHYQMFFLMAKSVSDGVGDFPQHSPELWAHAYAQ